MDELPFTPIDLVAIDAARNVRRRWRVAAYRDLFGQVMIETRWGRIGTQGRELVRSFADEAAARAYVRGLLARRERAVRRIGVAYRPMVPTRRHVDTSTDRDRPGNALTT
ncbi:WGR domain-containing protein [uncultured Sphingomonas sp.]|uniref:WGR domain-containing protein n=1 Tax=uncultured Sphingomonas sp. TaxID=158754 RepID=UPI0025E8FDE1|nr:WGR domain-containing protein [uncultured Sphingomonas sp.]